MKKLLIVLLVLALASPAMAAEFTFYGSLRTHLGWYSASEDYVGGPAMDPTISGGNGLANQDSDEGTLLNIGGQSRFGAKAVVSDQLIAVTEFGFRETSGGSDVEQTYLRMLYGSWNFGAGKLIVGKTYTPGTFLGYSSMQGDIGDQGDSVMLIGGLPYIGRQPLIELQFGTFELALIQPYTDAAVLGTFTDKDFTLPRIEAAYVFRTPVVAIRPVVGFQTYKIENEVTGADEDITSYLAGIGISLTLGSAYVKTTASYLQNAGNYGQRNAIVVSPTFNLPAAAGGLGSSILNAQLVGNNIEDSKLLQGTFVVGMKLNPSFSIEAGLGYSKADVDIAAGNAEQQGFLYYLQVPIAVAKGVQVIPEIGLLDRGDLEVSGLPDDDAGKLTYFDLNFRVDF